MTATQYDAKSVALVGGWRVLPFFATLEGTHEGKHGLAMSKRAKEDGRTGEQGAPLVSIQEACAWARRQGWQRVIVLGDESDERYARLKGYLVGSGVLVLAPGAEQRAWFARLATQVAREGTVGAQVLARVRAILSDGAEHGARALLVTSADYATLVALTDMHLPVLVIEGEEEGEP